ncbi:MAG: hypothetical protein Q7R34_14485 [Dehalococcoidia bacterium]|nr:hypothetical protein [Dehalococcoidia bacterium]
MSITWTSQQIKIFELVQEGKGPAEISKLLGCSLTVIHKVKHAIAAGLTPANKPPPKTSNNPPGNPGVTPPPGVPKASNPVDVNKVVSQYKHAQAEAGPEVNAETEEPEGEGNPGDESNQGNDPQQPVNSKQQSATTTKTSSTPPQGISTVMKMVTVPTLVAITPIMLNVRTMATEEWGWNPQMTWEDFFDTCLFILCQSMGFMLKAYYKIDKDGNPIDDEGNTSKPVFTRRPD